MSFEEAIQQQIFRSPKDKSYSDKLLTKEEAESIRVLMTKKHLTREDIQELLNRCAGVEAKLLNLSAWERYVLLKFYVWVVAFGKVAEGVHQYKEDLERKGNIPETTQQSLDNCTQTIEYMAKFLVNLYLNIARTTQSLGSSAFQSLISNKYEFVYPQQGVSTDTKKKGVEQVGSI
jgi:hypothetical protein